MVFFQRRFCFLNILLINVVQYKAVTVFVSKNISLSSNYVNRHCLKQSEYQTKAEVIRQDCDTMQAKVIGYDRYTMQAKVIGYDCDTMQAKVI